MFTLKAKKRTDSINLEALRKSGETPAVFYGAGKDTTPITLSTSEFKKIWREAGESTTIKVSVGIENINVLIHDVQVDPVTEEPLHADFLCIDMTKKITVGVPLEFEGVSEAVKKGEGNLVKVLHEIEVEALPADLPHGLTVDLSLLATVEDVILVSQIKLPPGVAAVTGAEDIVASIVLQVEEKEEEVTEPVDLSAIEVEKKGKKEEEGAEAEGKADAGATPAKDEKVEKTGEGK